MRRSRRAIPETMQHVHRDEGDVREARHADGEAGDRAAPPAGSHHRTSRPIRPPIQIDPAARCDPVEERATTPRGDVCAAWPATPGTSSTAPAASSAPTSDEQLRDRRRSPLGPVDPERDERGEREQRERQLEVDDSRGRTPRCACSGTIAPSRRPSGARTGPSRSARRPASRRARRRRHDERDRDGAQPRARHAPRRAAARSPMRRTNRPIAAIIDRNAIQRADDQPGVAAVSEIDGMTNCGAGPGFGPTANVNAPRTGWPSTEITRQ